jgi:hypothetical protein
MPGEEVCQVYREPHKEGRPLDLKFELVAYRGIEFISPDKILRQDYVRDQVLDSYKRDLEVILGNCFYCRILSRKFNHVLDKCSRRFYWIYAKNKALQTQKQEKKDWI